MIKKLLINFFSLIFLFHFAWILFEYNLLLFQYIGELFLELKFTQIVSNFIRFDPLNHIQHDFLFYLAFLESQFYIFEAIREKLNFLTSLPFIFFELSFLIQVLIPLNLYVGNLSLQFFSCLIHVIIFFTYNNQTMMCWYFFYIINLIRLFT